MSDPADGVPCLWMRGGTSKGAYFLAGDLPADPGERDVLILRIMGSPDPRQIDGIGGGIVFYLVGIPSPVTWGAVMFFLSFIPMFGTWIAWAPAAIYLALSGSWTGTMVVALWGLVSMFVVGNIIYTWLAGRRSSARSRAESSTTWTA